MVSTRGTRTIAISGSSGLIGSALARAREARGDVVRRLPRGPAAATQLGGVDAVVNLAGENIAQRWTRDTRRRIRGSRIDITTILAHAIADGAGPRVLISGSAIGIYGNRGDELLDEQSALGDDFLATVCREWEAAAEPAAQSGARLAYLRTGIVLSSRGGALAKMLPPFRLGVGGRMGSGRQWMSWISLRDTVRAIESLLDRDDAHGPYNVVAPEPVTNAQFTRVLGRVLHRPAILPLPALALRLAFGEMAEGTILASQRVRPRRLHDLGFEFQDADLADALTRSMHSSDR